jgi:integrase
MAASTFDDPLTWPKVGEQNRKSADAKPPTQPPLECPECGSSRIWKNGFRYARSETGGEIAIQRYFCRECGRRFSEDTALGSRMGSNPIHQQYTRPFAPYLGPNRYDFNRSRGPSTCQVCVTEAEGTKNLSQQRTRQKRAAGATAKPEVKGELVEFSWWLKKQGYAESTIRQYSKNIKILAERGADLYDPDSAKDVIARQEWSNARRSVIIASYTVFLHKHGESWEPPKCRVTRKLPFIPTEQEIDSLIAASGKKTATLLQLLKETAMRGGETDKLKWINIDTENRTVTLNTPEKNSLPRIFKVSNKLLGMLNSLPKRTEYVFGSRTERSRRATFYRTRQQAAKKLQNPRLLRITFHTLRHWKATMLYYQTKDILYVKNFLGHRKIENTLLYIQLAEVIFKETTDEFTVRVAQEPKEIKELLEVGFEFVCEKDGLMFFRKRK